MPDPVIEVKDVSFSYPRKQVFVALSFSLPKGLVGIVGPNGAGKTTFLRLSLGLLRPHRGSISVLGLDPQAESRKVRGLVGYVPEEDPFVPGLSALESVVLAGRLCGIRRKDCLRQAHALLDDLGLGEERYRRADTLSVGLRQRVKLAQALIADPPLLFLDEPTSGLDPRGREGLLRLIERLVREEGKTAILATHILSDLERICTYLLVLREGRVALCGEPRKLLLRGDKYHVSFAGGGDAFLGALVRAGAKVLEKARGEAVCQVPPSWRGNDFLRLAAETGTVLYSFRPYRERLADLLFSAEGEIAGCDSACS